MNDAALTKQSAYAQIRIREPAGERTFGPSLSIGGEGADVVVPGAARGAVLLVERREVVWVAQPAPGAAVRFNGLPLNGARDLRPADVLAVGAAQIIVRDVSRTLLRIEVCHLVGNTTIAPVGAGALALAETGDEEIEIRAERTERVASPPPQAPAPERVAPVVSRDWRRWVAPAVALAVLLGLLALVSMLEPVTLDVRPDDARVRTPGTLLSGRIGDRVFVLPGTHVFRADREGYETAETRVEVVDGRGGAARLRLAKLPGALSIETGGLAATVRIDGVQVGSAPGELSVPAGRRTITVSAPRYLDYVTDLEIEGAGAHQELEAVLQPAWGTLRITAEPASASVSVDGEPQGTAPAVVEALSGVRRVQVSAPGFKTWESTVVVNAGQTLELGPITLGHPDARVTIRSTPAGADIAVGGTHRGRTPVTVELPAGISHDVVLTLPGHETWTRSVFAKSGEQTTLDTRLTPVLARVTVEGEPADAELVIDGVVRGRTPHSLELTTVDHEVEVRKDGFLPFKTTVAPAKGLERRVTYKLTSANRAVALQESAPTIRTQSGYVLRLVPPGKFTMGSDRREQGRRPNEGSRTVTLERPYYIGVHEVTNAEFRRFRSGHASGYIGRQSLDLDDQPVTQITWHEAAAYSNWLSEREGLPPAYEQRNGRYELKRPVTAGYRLPTEAEWEYAARYVSSGRTRRFAWGDALPVMAEYGNLAGVEANESATTVLEGYRDDYPYIAPVGKFRPTALGLHDMAGNVSEWVNDYYLSFVDPAAVTDPLGPEEGSRHVVRGASWKSATVAELRFAWRDGAEGISPTIGFRVARYAE